MPLFFFLAGLFFYESLAKRSWVVFVASKVDSIIYPYIIWSIIQGSTEVMLGRFTNGTVTFSEVFNFLSAPRAQFWFLYAIFQIFILGSAIYRRKNKWYFLCISIISSIGYLNNFEISGFSRIQSLLPNFTFFSLGILYNEISDFMYRHRIKFLVPLLIIFIGGQWLFHSGLPVTSASGALPQFILALSSIIFVCVLCQNISSTSLPALAILGKFSMPIYLAHVITAAGVRIIFQKYFGITDVTLHVISGVLSGLWVPIMVNKLSWKIGCGFLFSIPRKFSLERSISAFSKRPL